MNFRRGMFRFWVLVTLAWLAGCTYWAYSIFADTELGSKYYVLQTPNDDFLALDSRFKPADFTKSHIRYDFPNEVVLLAHNSMTKEIVAERANEFDKKFVIIRDAELRSLKHQQIPAWLAGTVLPPAAIFFLGYALGWAFSGFRRERT
jgi:hypothetical protein